MKIVIPERLNSSFSNTRTCSDGECMNATREGKPYCPDHVGQNPYSSKVLEYIVRRAAEDEQIRLELTEPEDINVQGITAQEILQNIAEHGPRTKERLCRELSIEAKVMEGYIKALADRGLVAKGTTSRGSVVVSLRKK